MVIVQEENLLVSDFWQAFFRTLLLILFPLQNAVQDSLLKCLPAGEQTESLKAAGTITFD